MVVGRPHMTEQYERWRIREPRLFREFTYIPRGKRTRVKAKFLTHDIGRTGFSKRISGKLKKSGKWAIQSLLISHDEPPAMKKQLRKSAKEMIWRARR